jgi:hypothetical protein
MSDQPSTNPVRFLSLARLAPRFQIYFLLAFNLFLLSMLYNFSLSEKTDLPIDGVVFLFFLLFGGGTLSVSGLRTSVFYFSS